MNATQHSLFNASQHAADDIVFIAVTSGQQAIKNDDGTIKLFPSRDDAEAAKGSLGTSAAVAWKNLHLSLYGAKMPKGEDDE
jgi:hypothetical protein